MNEKQNSSDTVDASGECGSNVHWSYEDNILVIKGTGKVTTAPWKEAGKLEEIVFPSTLEVISDRCFYDCELLSKITVPENIKKIGSKAFRSCDGLETIEFLSENMDEVEIMDEAFLGIRLEIDKVIAIKESDKLKEIFKNAEFEYTGE